MEKTNSDWQAFLQLCLDQKTPEALAELFEFFLTFDEREDLMNRYLLTKALLEGDLTQREIAKTLGVSIAKITRGSNALKIMPKEVRDELHNRLI